MFISTPINANANAALYFGICTFLYFLMQARLNARVFLDSAEGHAETYYHIFYGVSPGGDIRKNHTQLTYHKLRHTMHDIRVHIFIVPVLRAD